MGQPYLSVQGIIKRYGKFIVLDKVSFSVEKKEFVCLLGPSGCGKTTLLRIIAGFEEPDAGKIVLDGKDVTYSSPANRKFGMVFQSYALFPNMTVYENIAYGLKAKKYSKREIKERVRELLALVHLEYAQNKYPIQLSGGEQQRVAFARALVLFPDLLLLDEPLSALDVKVRIELRREIRRLQEKLGITTVMVTHDQEEALTIADKIVVMNKGAIMQIGKPVEIYDRPKNSFVADFVGAINFFEIAGNCESSSTRIAIRPEDIRIVESSCSTGIKAIVTDMEFRGAYYRIMLQNVEEKLIKANQDFAIHLPSYQIKKLQLLKEKVLFVELPEDRLIFCDDQPC